MSSIDTICTHEGDTPEDYLGSIGVPIFQTSLFSYKKKDSGYRYTRASNPTIENAEVKIAALEEGESAACFSSGMGAISSSILHFVKNGSTVLVHRNVYGPAQYFLKYLKRFGVTTQFINSEKAIDFESAMGPQTALVYLESPSTFLFKVLDIQGIAEAARKRGIPLVVDNTWATPIYQKPLALGADLVVHSASKYLGGHSDIVAGVVVGKKELIQSIATEERSNLGSNMDPHQAFLLIRGLRTLSVRMERHSKNAERVANYLQTSPFVSTVLWPGLPDRPDKTLVNKHLSGFSGVMSFIPTFDLSVVPQFLATLKLFEVGPSWGGFESLAIAPGIFMDPKEMLELGIPPTLIRISVGLENVEDIIQDLDQALKMAVQKGKI